MLEPIYITGAGVVSAIGIGKAETAALQKGLSGIGEMKYLRSVHRELPVGEVKLSNAEMMKMLGADPDPRLTRTALIGKAGLARGSGGGPSFGRSPAAGAVYLLNDCRRNGSPRTLPCRRRHPRQPACRHRNPRLCSIYRYDSLALRSFCHADHRFHGLLLSH